MLCYILYWISMITSVFITTPLLLHKHIWTHLPFLSNTCFNQSLFFPFLVPAILCVFSPSLSYMQHSLFLQFISRQAVSELQFRILLEAPETQELATWIQSERTSLSVLWISFVPYCR